MTYSEIYTYVKSAVAKKDVKKLGDIALSIYVTDEGATGEFYIAVKGGQLEIENFKYDDYTAHLSISSADLKKIVDGKKVSYSFDDGDDAQGKALIAALTASAPAYGSGGAAPAWYSLRDICRCTWAEGDRSIGRCG